MPIRFLRRFLAVFAGLALLALARSKAYAHELEIDRLSLWPDRAVERVRGQVSFDPELTRELDLPLERERAERRVVEFLQRNLWVLLNDRECAPSFQVRELYTRGGAVPGDIVMLSCPLPPRLERLSVRVGPALPSVVVTVSGFTQDARPESSLVQGGTTSPRYFIEQPSSSEWRVGGPDQFATAGASSAPVTGPANPSGGVTAPVPRATRPPAGFEPARPLEVAGRYLLLGFHHILPLGWDHVLFVVALTLGRSRQLRRLLLELTCFTLAHTLTLGLSAWGVSMIPTFVVEPLIALSIACMGAFNLVLGARPSPRLALIFAFGLVHGQGFAGALLDAFVATDARLAALAGFNVGVELGQAAVVLVLWAVLRPIPERLARRYVVAPLSLVTIAVGCYFTLERSLGG